jgi:hypothetical protein
MLLVKEIPQNSVAGCLQKEKFFRRDSMSSQTFLLAVSFLMNFGSDVWTCVGLPFAEID